MGDKVKKFFLWMIVALVSGAFLGKYTFDKYEKVDVKNVISYDNDVYMIKYGTYKNLDEMTEEVDDVERYIYIEKEDEIDVYLAITHTKRSAEKIKDIYDSKDIVTSIEKVNIPNDEFIQNLNEYEKLLSSASDDASILIIEKEILSCYESLMVEDE